MSIAANVALKAGDDAIEQLLTRLLDAHSQRLPDLQALVIITPDASLASECRERLLQTLRNMAQHAVIPPWCGSLRDWILHTVPALPGQYLGAQARRLLFIDALDAHSTLFQAENKWQVAFALLQLFDELCLQHITLSPDTEVWQTALEQHYGLSGSHALLAQEAHLVHTLWHAWLTQLEANGQRDASLDYVDRLSRASAALPADGHIYILGSDSLSAAETRFITALQAQARCTVFDFGTDDSDTNPYWQFIRTAFDHTSATLLERSVRAIKSAPLPVLPLTLYAAHDAESEARAVDLQIRLWLHQGKQTIGVVCEDRKLSRRVRALLERANVALQDMAGWSLATTSAAAVLERWLECIEQDFDYRAFLDVLKSPGFACADRDEHLKNVYRLEHDIIQRENIARSLARYRQQLVYRQHRLEHWPANSYQQLDALLQHCAHAAAPLLALHNNARAVPASDYLGALYDSLHALGFIAAFTNDAAGQRVLQCLDDMREAGNTVKARMHWLEFRHWLGMSLEEQHFKPQTNTASVKLMTLAQANLRRFDALIIAATDQQHLPGSSSASPFFNQGVRESLGLVSWQTQRRQRLQLFQRLLLGAPEILISYKSHDNDEPLPMSPWIEALRVHHPFHCAGNLANTLLDRLLAQDCEVFICDSADIPAMPTRPAPAINTQLISTRVSASAHQRLINCPYQYFAADALRLQASDEVSEELSKAEYGERVHLILRAFHQAVPNLPTPFGELLTAQSRERAIAHLLHLSEFVFARDQQDNVLHRSWLHRWLGHVTAYIDWEIERQQHWRIEATETRCSIRLDDTLEVDGRLDRIDRAAGRCAIIDYKTGKNARQQDVNSGEDVQLVTYAMLRDDVDEAFYLALDKDAGKVNAAAMLKGDDLHTLRTQCQQRLQSLFTQLRAQQPVTAWGDSITCTRCRYDGLCRKQVWQ